MAVYIKAASNISPQNTFNNSFFVDKPVEHNGNRLTCIEPDYRETINPKLIRRMSRVTKMGVATAMACLKKGGVEMPDAIITATAYGCLEDTGIFLTNMVQQNEEPLSPTAFVHSTHNTIGAQVALLLQCTNYNTTYVNGGSSFESALLDAMSLIAENSASNILTGAIDEITNISHAILSRFGLYKSEQTFSQLLFEAATKGTIAGEGAAFFLLSGERSVDDLASIEAVTTFYKPRDIKETIQQAKGFLANQSINPAEIDLIITGNNGDTKNDQIYHEVMQSVFEGVPNINYKQLCGEYPTSTGFALWLGANIIKNNKVPPAITTSLPVGGKINQVLIYNHYQNIYHSLILISPC